MDVGSNSAPGRQLAAFESVRPSGDRFQLSLSPSHFNKDVSRTSQLVVSSKELWTYAQTMPLTFQRSKDMQPFVRVRSLTAGACAVISISNRPCLGMNTDTARNILL